MDIESEMYRCMANLRRPWKLTGPMQTSQKLDIEWDVIVRKHQKQQAQGDAPTWQEYHQTYTHISSGLGVPCEVGSENMKRRRWVEASRKQEDGDNILKRNGSPQGKRRTHTQYRRIKIGKYKSSTAVITTFREKVRDKTVSTAAV